MMLLNELKAIKENSVNADNNRCQDLGSEDSVNCESVIEVKNRKQKKLVSGKCTKPDESDIKVVVKYAHEKLDVKHVQDWVFDRLPFHLLVAGELEIALLQNEPERSAGIQLAKTVCYHKQYLKDEDLRNGYDSILKRVEQGAMTWEDQLGEEPYKHYDYRTNVLLRERLHEGAGKADRADRGDRSIEVRNKEVIFEDMEKCKPVFCMEFNRGECTQSDLHKGSFSGKRCIKWHICRRCRRFSELCNHLEDAPNCPRKG